MAVYVPLLQPEVTVLRNSKGVTLVEVMLALVITLIIFIGLIQASIRRDRRKHAKRVERRSSETVLRPHVPATFGAI